MILVSIYLIARLEVPKEREMPKPLDKEKGRELLCFRPEVSFFFQAEDGIRDRSPSRGLGDVYKRQKQYSGDYLMKVGLNVFSQTDGTSHVLVLE